MTQRHIGVVLCIVWLLCAALLVADTIRIPPSRPGALRVQSAGVVSTGTGTAVAPTAGLIRYYHPSTYSVKGAGTPDTMNDSSGHGQQMKSYPNDAAKPTVSGDHLVFTTPTCMFSQANDIKVADFDADVGITFVARITISNAPDAAQRTLIQTRNGAVGYLAVSSVSGGNTLLGSYIYTGSSTNDLANGTTAAQGASPKTVVWRWSRATTSSDIYVDGALYHHRVSDRYGDSIYNHCGVGYFLIGAFGACPSVDFYGCRIYNYPLSDADCAGSKDWSWAAP